MARWDRTQGRPEPIHLLNRVPERENGEPLVDIRVYAPAVRILRPTVIPYVRQTVAEMCQRAALSLPDGVYLGLIEGWRPLARQQRIYNYWWNSAKEKWPDRSYAAMRRTVCRMVAPTDQKAPPGHCTGAAVDVNLIDAENEARDVSSPFERMEATSTYTLGLSPEAHDNRMTLVRAMLDAGFSNCRDEWWHYSFGDAGWAVRMGEPACFYGMIELDPSLYQDLEEEHEEAVKKRPNPFVPPPDAE